jgi:hypothetical protein
VRALMTGEYANAYRKGGISWRHGKIFVAADEELIAEPRPRLHDPRFNAGTRSSELRIVDRQLVVTDAVFTNMSDARKVDARPLYQIFHRPPA